ncbi:MAG TPA: two-component regulator propeller domain-containing protein [Anaerolineaceae bacterium]|nr:two-component regulator propeller domain-containing protein [Anaerolineaceae bacterium]
MSEVSSEKAARPSRWRQWQVISLIVVLAALVRIWSAWQLPIDADEPVYMAAAQDYARLIKSGNLQGIINYQVNTEHPPLEKLIYSLPYIFIQPQFGSTTELTINRMVSVFWGTAAVLVLALIDPLAGFFLAWDSMVIKYTSEIYLEALPLFAILFSIYSLMRSLQGPKKNAWFWIAAIAFGVAISGKYLYGLAIFPILTLFFVNREKIQIRDAGFFMLAALFTFWALDPYLWADPIGRLANSLFFHAQYTQGADVLRASYPWYQPVNWISAEVPWHPQVFFFPTLDVVIFILAIIGLYPAARRNVWIIVWIGTSFLTLLVWPTKWPQYTLVLIPPLCLAASGAFYFIASKAREFDTTWNWAEAVLPRPGKVFWWALILFVFGLVTAKVLFEIHQAQSRIGWISIRSEYSPLVSNKVNDLAFDQTGRLLLGTDKGLSIWMPNDKAPWGDTQVNFTTENSGLASLQVTSLLQDDATNWWIGTANGLNYTDLEKKWETYHAQDMGLASSQINDIKKDGQGHIWVGTNAGAAEFDGSHWKPITQQNSGLADNAVYTIGAQPGAAIWFGHLKGISRLDLITGKWTQTELSSYGFGWGGTVDILEDRQNRVWAATIGSGLNVWDGEKWDNYRASNSGLPQNNVNRIIEAPNGVFWLACSYSTEPGGAVASFDGKNWNTYDSSTSGFSGSEPLTLAMDARSRLWIGTSIGGISIYQVYH